MKLPLGEKRPNDTYDARNEMPNTIHAETMSTNKAAISGARGGNDCRTAGIVCAQALPLISPLPLCDGRGDPLARWTEADDLFGEVYLSFGRQTNVQFLCVHFESLRQRMRAARRRSLTLARGERTHMISLPSVYGFAELRVQNHRSHP